MELPLSWDIVFVILFIVVFGVALIRPHKFTLRLLFGTYLSLMIAEGAVFFFEKIILSVAPMLQSWVSEREVLVFMGLRVFLFAVALTLFLIRGHYHIEHKKHDHWLARLILHIFFEPDTCLK